MTSILRIIATATAVLAVTIGLTGGRHAHAESWADVVAAANREGRLVWYQNQRAQGTEPLLQRFRAAYPRIRTESVRITSNAMMERFLTEYNAGRHLADVVTTFNDERVMEGLDQPWMAEWSMPEAAHFPPQYILRNRLITLSHAREAIVWNTNLVRAQDAPREWTDLFNPRWRGTVGMNSPWRALPVLQLVALWEDRLGLGDTAQRMRQNNVLFFEGSGGVIQALIRGDVRVATVTDSTLNPLIEDGAPIGVHYPQSGTTTSATVTFVAGRAPNPNAARVFVNWLMTREGAQHMQNELALSVTRRGMPPLSKLPSTEQLPNAVSGEDLLTPARRRQIVEHWQRVYGVR